MGYIYKITNTLNKKVYIGQTSHFYEIRFAEHKRNCKYEYFKHLKLYRAFNKYGIENFNFDVIEEVDNNKLDEREIYWIEYYDSYYEGYNSTLGGKSCKLYEWDIEKIISLYNEHKSARKVAEIMNCDHSSIDKILNTYNIPRFTLSEQRAKGIIHLENNDLSINKTFNSTTECSRWLIENNYTKTKRIEVVNHNLRARLREGKRYFNFKIYYESKI